MKIYESLKELMESQDFKEFLETKDKTKIQSGIGYIDGRISPGNHINHYVGMSQTFSIIKEFCVAYRSLVITAKQKEQINGTATKRES